VSAGDPAAALLALREAGVVAAFSTRVGGVSAPPFDQANLSTRVGDEPAAVHANRRLLAERLGLAGRPLVTVRQAHTAEVVPVSRSDLPDGTAWPHALEVVADGMATREPGVVLMIGVADCLPVVLADPRRRAVAVLHVGWRGLLRGIVESGIRRLEALGGRREACVAVAGPGIGPCCYPVAAELRDRVAAVCPSAAAVTRDGTPAVDLPAGTAEALRRAGVAAVHVQASCTAEEAASYFSARRDGRTGSQAGVVALL
jgi:YfiH family protein